MTTMRILTRALAVLAILGGFLALGPRPAAAGPPTGFASVVTQRNLVQPTSFGFAPTGQLFIAEQRGTIQAYDSFGDESPTQVADLRTVVHNHHDRGLLGLEVDPAWPARPYIYALLSYDAPPYGGDAPFYGQPGEDSDPCPAWTGTYLSPDGGCPGQTRVARLEFDDQQPQLGLTLVDLQWLLTDVCREFQFHDGGGIRMAGGQLYAALGDGAWPNSDVGTYGTKPDPCDEPPGEGGSLKSQDARTAGDELGASGSVVRLDPDVGGIENWQAAYGLRNPFRMAVAPDGALWIGDVGQARAEELNRLDPAGPTVNFGWPCYEGAAQSGDTAFHQAPICQALYAEGSATAPVDGWCHAGTWPDACTVGSGSVSGLAFGPTGDLFVADYTRETIYRKAGGVGPLEPWATDVGGPVELRFLGADLFYLDVFTGELARIYAGVPGNPPPEPPAPTAVIDTPTPETVATIGQEIGFSGSATSETGQPLPPSALRWTLVVLHCADQAGTECHRHFVESRSGVSSGTFAVPAHDGSWRLEVVLRAQSGGSSDTVSVVLNEQPKAK